MNRVANIYLQIILTILLLLRSGALVAANELSACEISFFSKYILSAIDQEHVFPPDNRETFAARVLDEWFYWLDPNKEFFMEAEVNVEVLMLSKTLFSDLENQKFDHYRTIIDLMKKREQERLQKLHSLLEQGISFASNEVYSPAVRNTLFPSSTADAESRTLSRLKFMTLDGKAGAYSHLSLSEISKIIYQDWVEDASVIANLTHNYHLQLLLEAMPQSLDPYSKVNFVVTDGLKQESSVQTEAKLGLGIHYFTRNGRAPVIFELLDDGPAAKSGAFEIGDHIHAIRFEDSSEWLEYSEVDITEEMSKRNDEWINVRLYRPKEKTTHTVKIRREVIGNNFKRVSGKVRHLPASTTQQAMKLGIVTIPSFYSFTVQKGTSEEEISTVDDVRAIIERDDFKDVDAVVLDLSGNTGGILGQAFELVGLFTDRILFKSFSQHEKDFHKAITTGEICDKKLIVIVDHRSASAAEVTAAALQDDKRALIVGSPTFGKSSVQTSQLINFKIGQGREIDVELYLTTQIMYRISGVAIQRIGVIPDVNLPPLRFPGENYEIDHDLSLVAPRVFKKRAMRDRHTFDISLLNRRSRVRRNKDPRFATLIDGNREIEIKMQENQFSLRENGYDEWYPADYLQLVYQSRATLADNHIQDNSGFYRDEIFAIIRDHVEQQNSKDNSP